MPRRVLAFPLALALALLPLTAAVCQATCARQDAPRPMPGHAACHAMPAEPGPGAQSLSPPPHACDHPTPESEPIVQDGRLFAPAQLIATIAPWAALEPSSASTADARGRSDGWTMPAPRAGAPPPLRI